MTFALNYILFWFVPSVGVAAVLCLEMICIEAQANLGDLYQAALSSAQATVGMFKV